MTLKRAFLERYRKDYMIQYTSNLLDILTTEDAVLLNLYQQRETIQHALNNLKNTERKRSELTPRIAVLNKKRNTIYVGFKHTVDAWSKNHYDDSLKQAALSIINTLKSYGKRVDLIPYQEKTATLNAIIYDLEGKLSAQINLLNLNEWVIQLKTLNTEFDTLYLERVKALSKTQKGASTTFKKELITSLKSLKTLFEARLTVAVLDKTSNLKAFNSIAKKWDALTQQYNRDIIRNKTLKPPSSNKNKTLKHHSDLIKVILNQTKDIGPEQRPKQTG